MKKIKREIDMFNNKIQYYQLAHFIKQSNTNTVQVKPKIIS